MKNYWFRVVRGSQRGELGSWCPEMLGCVVMSTGDIDDPATWSELETKTNDAVSLHLRGLREDGDDVPAADEYAVRLIRV